jgi:glycosyltransferase involved in cell wall biosynthesis
VPPPLYGGTEEVVDHLARGLDRAGHDVTVFTTGDATVPVRRRWVYDTPPEAMNVTAPECRHVQAAYEELSGCDIIHDHTLIGPIWSAAVGSDVPVVTTVHNPFTDDSRPLYVDIARHAAVVAISHDHRSTAPEVPVAAVIHHGLDADRFKVGAGAGGYLLFVGRLAPEKGAREAVEIARQAGMPLRIAAKMRAPDEQAYFAEEVEPLLGHGVEYLGEIGTAERDRAYGEAIALLNPITWAEPFGLVMIEAMACGTPVVGFPAGAAPEIVTDGVTGFLVDDVDGAAEAVGRISSIDRGVCRQWFEEHFSADRMVADYVRLYERILAGDVPTEQG